MFPRKLLILFEIIRAISMEHVEWREISGGMTEALLVEDRLNRLFRAPKVIGEASLLIYLS